jgi:N-acetylneuraminate synthase
MSRSLEDHLKQSTGDVPPRCLVIGEVAQAHDGSLGAAHAYIDAIAAAGADAVKFQTHIASAESTPSEPWRVKFSRQDRTRYDYWKRMEFTDGQWLGLKHHADERGLLFLSSPFSVEAVELLTRVGVAGWKVASGEVTNRPMFERMAATGWPFLLSTGMSSWEEIDAAVAWVREAGLPLGVLQCTSAYPCPAERVGLNLLEEYRARYGVAVGLSDHTGAIYAGLAAAALGAAVLEVHVTFSREAFGPDVPASLTTTELRQLVQGVRAITEMRGHPLDKDAAADELQGMRRLFNKSLVAREDLPAGTWLSAAHLAIKKPGTGLSPEQLSNVVGRRLLRDLRRDELLAATDLDPVLVLPQN